MRAALAAGAVLLSATVTGYGVAQVPLLVAAFGGAVAGCALLVALVRWPPLVPVLFWVTYTVQFTLFVGATVQGLYYPLYLLMAANLVLALCLDGLEVDVRALLPYSAFLLIVLVSLLRTDATLDFDVAQQLFTYFLGLLVVVQFSRPGPAGAMPYGQVLASLLVAGWVIERSITSGFAERAGIELDQNTISFFMGFGLLVLVSHLMERRVSLVRRILTWAALGVGAYALLLLASRGVSLAFAIAAVGMYARISSDARRSIGVALPAVLAGVLVLSLPGSDALLNRFQQADLSTANSRLPLWRAGLEAFTNFGPYEIFFGRGLDSSEGLMRSVLPSITSTHNAYLQMLLEFGLLGLAAFAAIHARLLWRFWGAGGAMASYGVGAVAFMVMANLTLTTPDEFLYWVAIGHLIALQTDLGRPRAHPDEPPALHGPRVRRS